jgi:type IV secretion system protein TrbL
MGSAASTAYKLGQETSGSTSIGAGIGGMASAAKGATTGKMKNAFGLRAAAARGQQAAWAAGGSGGAATTANAPGGSAGDGAPPAWAQKLQGAQASRHRRQMAIHAIRDGDKGGAGANPDIKERD